MRPDDVLEDVADVLRLVERGQDRADCVRADLVAALNQLDQLLDDRARRGDMLLVAVQGQPVPAQGNRRSELLSQRIEDAVLDARELRRDLVRDVQDLV